MNGDRNCGHKEPDAPCHYGDCSHETFEVKQQETEWRDTTDDPLVFTFCKTASKPYDLVVTAGLIVFQFYFGDEFKVSSDGEEEDWQAARELCQRVLGYGIAFRLNKDGEE